MYIEMWNYHYECKHISNLYHILNKSLNSWTSLITFNMYSMYACMCMSALYECMCVFMCT